MTGRTDFGVAVHDIADLSSEITEHAVLNTVVDVDGSDFIKDANADTIIAVHVLSKDRLFETSESASVARHRSAACHWVVGNFRGLPFAVFVPPATPRSIRSELGRDIVNVCFQAVSAPFSVFSLIPVRGKDLRRGDAASRYTDG